MIEFLCPHCGKMLSVEDQYAGQKGKCAKCRNYLYVPERSEEEQVDSESMPPPPQEITSQKATVSYPQIATTFKIDELKVGAGYLNYCSQARYIIDATLACTVTTSACCGMIATMLGFSWQKTLFSLSYYMLVVLIGISALYRPSKARMIALAFTGALAASVPLLTIMVLVAAGVVLRPFDFGGFTYYFYSVFALACGASCLYSWRFVCVRRDYSVCPNSNVLSEVKRLKTLAMASPHKSQFMTMVKNKEGKLEKTATWHILLSDAFGIMTDADKCCIFSPQDVALYPNNYELLEEGDKVHVLCTLSVSGALLGGALDVPSLKNLRDWLEVSGNGADGNTQPRILQLQREWWPEKKLGSNKTALAALAASIAAVFLIAFGTFPILATVIALAFSEGVRDIPKDPAKAVTWYRIAALMGHSLAQHNLGVCYDIGKGVAQDRGEAVVWYRKAAEQGFADAQYDLGICYLKGEGVPENGAEAVKWLRAAAEQGSAEAQYNLGICYLNGEGVPENGTEAVKWFRTAADQGNSNAQTDLGGCYELGVGVVQDKKEAANWYRKAAEQGSMFAQFNLGLCYLKGEGLPENGAEAVKWFRAAAEQGNSKAQVLLALCYEGGVGVEADKVEAVNWLRKAADQGDEGAKKALQEYENGIVPVLNASKEALHSGIQNLKTDTKYALQCFEGCRETLESINHPEAKQMLAEANAYIAQVVASSGHSSPEDLSRALRLAQEASNAFPENASFLDTLALVYYFRGEHQSAIVTQRQAIRLLPGMGGSGEAASQGSREMESLYKAYSERLDTYLEANK